MKRSLRPLLVVATLPIVGDFTRISRYLAVRIAAAPVYFTKLYSSGSEAVAEGNLFEA